MDGSENGNGPDNGASSNDNSNRANANASPNQQQQQQPAGISRTEYMRRLGAERTQQTQQARAAAERFRADAHAQTIRIFGNRPEPSLLLSYMQPHRLDAISAQVSVLAGRSGHMLTDTQVEAVGEHVNSVLGFHSGWRIFSHLAVLWLTFRPSSRLPFRFPFFQPQYQFRGSPFGGSRVVRLGWHALRYIAYRLTWGFLVTSPVAFSSAVRHDLSLRKDERLKDLFAGSKAGQALAQDSFYQVGQQTSPAANRSAFEESPGVESPGGESWAGQGTQQHTPTSTNPEGAWSRLDQGQYKRPQLPEDSSQQANKNWDAEVDNFDDTSPVAQPANPEPSFQSRPGASAWDRIRRDSQTRPEQQPRSHRRNLPHQDSKAWGEDAGTSPEYHGPRESYSYRSADEDRTLAKDQAQQQFDWMLDQERRGVDQELNRRSRG